MAFADETNRAYVKQQEMNQVEGVASCAVAESANARIAFGRISNARGASELEILRQRLHDGLGQLLTSACFRVSALREKLAARGGPIDPSEFDEVLGMLNQAVTESRALMDQCGRPNGVAGAVSR